MGTEAERHGGRGFVGRIAAGFAGPLSSASPIELVPLGVAQRVLHGDNDDVVPLEISRRYVAAAKQSGDDSKLIEVAGAGHFELIDPRSSAWPVVKEAVLELVNKTPSHINSKIGTQLRLKP